MSREHWFDGLCRAMHGISRRDIARSGAMLLPGLLAGGLSDPAVAGKPHKKKGRKDKGKDNKPNKPKKPKPPAKPDICDTTWPGAGNAGNREHCRFMREQCKAPGNGPFCITRRIIDEEVHQVADCCPVDWSCCDGSCRDTSGDPAYCGPGCGKLCRPDEDCVNGTCVHKCVHGAGQGYENWTQPCPGAPTPCIPVNGLCCGSYWCWNEQEVECCPGTETCRTAEESCPGGPLSS